MLQVKPFVGKAMEVGEEEGGGGDEPISVWCAGAPDPLQDDRSRPNPYRFNFLSLGFLPFWKFKLL